MGYLNESWHQIIVPLERTKSCRDEDAMLEVYRRLYDDELEAWTFRFHAVCWDILLDQLSITSPPEIDRTATILHQLLYCTTWSRHGYLRPGNDLGGAIRFQDHDRASLRRMEEEGFGYLTADPSRVATRDNTLHGWNRSSADYERLSEELGLSDSHAQNNAFFKLPTEVIHILLSWLQTDDLLRFRLASRPIANLSRPDVLPQSFWRSRFSPPFELGYALPLQSERYQDWRNLYFAVRDAVNDPEGPGVLKNRKRIWDIISTNVPLFRSHLRPVELAGESIAPIRYQTSEDIRSDELELGNMVATQMMDIETVPLPVGSRQLFDRGLDLNLDGFTITAVAISTITLHGRIFISGLRFLVRDAHTGMCKDHGLGYLMSESETTLQVPSGKTFKGLELAARVNGLVAVRCILESGHWTYCDWIGDVGEGGQT